MNVEMPELLQGCVAALSEPPDTETAGAFTAGKIGVVALIALVAAQEAERGSAVRLAENHAIRALLRRALDENWPGADAPLRALAEGVDEDLTFTALDRSNADLKLALITLHEAAEATPGPEGRTREHLILQLLRTAALARQVVLPGTPG